ncbi:unnamed protein product [Chondrus crispus]|uniref:HTH psq-type domain-containing protein n=1 Tax=Chondrus crispus TaxID=2769 RepID=R7QC31_CHOCR|nr:unnamed protein product [Chondrus crispus]CDF35634.1 unnamed protein product [Chondrus crispus]|eukprot:XP_005715453.1 unnamed protein product [Chondrus crispus]
MISEKISKAKRTRPTIAQKIEVGHLLQVRNANTTVMRQFKISERTIRNIKRSLPSLQQIVTNTATTLGTKTLHPAHYPTLKAHLIEPGARRRPCRNCRILQERCGGMD